MKSKSHLNMWQKIVYRLHISKCKVVDFDPAGRQYIMSNRKKARRSLIVQTECKNKEQIISLMLWEFIEKYLVMMKPCRITILVIREQAAWCRQHRIFCGESTASLPPFCTALFHFGSDTSGIDGF